MVDSTATTVCPNSSMRSFLKYWAPVIAWTLSIFIASGDSMSSEHTSRFLVPFLLWFEIRVFSPEAIWWIQFFIRKGSASDRIRDFWRCFSGARRFSHRTNHQTRLPQLFAKRLAGGDTRFFCVRRISSNRFVPSRDAYCARTCLIDSSGAPSWAVDCCKILPTKRVTT